jgi:HD-GYP domain-containing protein (c-di-GMP phosphodiesterase class II)
MKLISLNKIADNMVLAKNVYAREGNVLLAKDALLKQSYLNRLLDWGVNSVYVQDKQGDLLEIDEDLCQQAKDVVLQSLREFFADLNNEQLPESVKLTLEAIMKQLLANKDILWNLVEIRAVSDSVFKHCVNVSILSMIIGSYLGYNVNHLTELAAGAILIDLGKTVVSHNLLNDPSLLSSQENKELQEHTRLGFAKLKQFKGNYENAAQLVLQHHEKYDGTGFPQGLKGAQIHEYARIAAIADIFHLYQTTSHEFDPSKLINDGSGTFFDPELTRLFSQKIVPLIRSGIEDDDALRVDQSLSVKEYEVDSELSTGANIDTKLKRPSKAEYKHSAFPRDNEKHSSLLGQISNVFGHFTTRMQTPVKTETPEPVSSKIKDEQEYSSITKSQNSASAHPRTLPSTDRFVVNPERCQRTKADALKIVDRFITKLSTELIPGTVIESTRLTIEELINDNDVLSNLVTIQALNDDTFNHCIIVGLLSVMTGVSLGYAPEQLKELGAGSLLVDLGKVEIARKYNVDSRSFGTAEYIALMPQHTQLGFELLWKLRRNTNTPYIALHHHERFDGSGYPVGLMGQQINEFARIVALADAYDTLINKGVNGQKLLPHEVIEYIRDYSGSHFDPEISRVFLQNTTPFLIGSNVLLNTGEKATVIKINKELLARPVIRVILDKNGNKLAPPIAKDLATDLTLFIVAALKDDEF